MGRGIRYDKNKGLILSSGGVSTGGTDGYDVVFVTTGGTVTITGSSSGATIFSISGVSGPIMEVIDS